MKLTTITRLKNGQYVTTVPKAWIEEASLEGYRGLNWIWEASDDGTVIVKAFKFGCPEGYIDKNTGEWHSCLLDEGHEEEHEYTE